MNNKRILLPHRAKKQISEELNVSNYAVWSGTRFLISSAISKEVQKLALEKYNGTIINCSESEKAELYEELGINPQKS
jgi:hypothetical protein